MSRWVIAVAGMLLCLNVTAQSLSAQQRSMIEQLQNMTPEQREAFMAKMQKQAQVTQSCFENVDQAKIKALEARGQEVSAKIDALCKAGKTREAEAFAQQEGRKMMSDPTARQLSNCSQGFSKAFDFSPEAVAARGGSVCD